MHHLDDLHHYALALQLNLIQEGNKAAEEERKQTQQGVTLFRQISVPVVPLKRTWQITEIRKVEFMHWICKIHFNEVHRKIY